jgi:hypothetical protein
MIARIMGTPNVRPSAVCTRVVIQTARFIVGSWSRIFLPNQTTGKVNNVPPAMTLRFTGLERDALIAHHHNNQINNKRTTLERDSIVRFMVSSFLL